MPYNLLLLPLLGGFLFIHLTHFFRFAAQRLDGYRLLLQSAIAGICLVCIARVIIELLGLSDFGVSALNVWNRFFPFPYSAETSLSFGLAPAFAGSVNLFISTEKAKSREISRHGNALTRPCERQNSAVTLCSGSAVFIRTAFLALSVDRWLATTKVPTASHWSQ